MSLLRHRYPASVRRKLKRAGCSEKSDMTPEAQKALERAPENASADRLRDIALGKTLAQPAAAKAAPAGEAPAKRVPRPSGKPTMTTEAIRLLRERGPMHYKDLTEAVLAEGVVKSKGATPAQTLSAALGRHAEVERVAPGVFKAKEASGDE